MVTGGQSGGAWEKFRPPANAAPGKSVRGKLLFALRNLIDLQVATVRRHLIPWLAGCRGRILEVGCGAQPYRHFVPSCCAYTGLDWEGARENFSYSVPDTVYYQGEHFPFPDASFDRVFHTEVLEHILKDDLFLKECRRVLTPGGEMFFTVPFQARYHYIPFDYRRYTPAALQAMLEDAGFVEIEITARGSDITVAAYKALSIVYRWLRSGVSGKLLGMAFLPLAVLALAAGHVSIGLRLGSSDDCLGYSVTARA